MKAIALINHSTDPIVGEQLEVIASALTKQLCLHYSQVHQAVGVPVVVYESESHVPADCVIAAIFDDTVQQGILGYHDMTPKGRPYAKVFWKPIKESGGTVTKGDNSLSVDLSHECLELMGDPYANAWADMGDRDGTEEAWEICDRVEGDSYEIDGIAVSNFLAPAAFRNGPGPYDYLGLQGDSRGLKTAWEIRSNGYAIRRTGGPNGDTNSVFGSEYPERKRAAKTAEGSKAHKRGMKVAV